LIGAFNVAGTYTQPMIGPGHNPDTGTRWDFTGTGKTKKLGTFTLTGSVTGPGFIASARASGKLLITTARGTITLYLHGPPQTPGTLPSYFSWSIGRGTGAYLHSTGKGVFLVSASDATHKFLFRFNPPT
jgi:hypothetical protein